MEEEEIPQYSEVFVDMISPAPPLPLPLPSPDVIDLSAPIISKKPKESKLPLQPEALEVRERALKREQLVGFGAGGLGNATSVQASLHTFQLTPEVPDVNSEAPGSVIDDELERVMSSFQFDVRLHHHLLLLFSPLAFIELPAGYLVPFLPRFFKREGIGRVLSPTRSSRR